MQTIITILRPDTQPETHILDLPSIPEWSTITTIIKPHIDGHIERVRVWHGGIYTNMFVDEDFQQKKLPYNAEATKVYRANIVEHEPKTDPDSLGTILGNAVLFSRRVYF